MHMADALISPAVGAGMWAVTASIAAYSARNVTRHVEDSRVPLMGVLGAFVFAAQMINFSIPATGSSGHLGGGMLLAILLGPQAAFLVIASILVVQALFFADGGLLALGCNIFNMGFFPAFIGYPWIYKTMAGDGSNATKRFWAILVAAVVSLQLGAFAVVLETTASGISELPFGTFVLLMQPIHLAIGIVEGIATAAVVAIVWKARPEIVVGTSTADLRPTGNLKPVLVGLGVAAVLTAGVVSWFASSHPDGLEWSIAGVTGKEELEAPETGVHGVFSHIQRWTAFMPDYNFKPEAEAAPAANKEKAEEATWPAIEPGTSLAGIIGSIITLMVALGIGYVLRIWSRKTT
ncbi:MAG: energy-coupling factor ABC transporter permease [Thermodesulfobacteriota bacterium]